MGEPKYTNNVRRIDFAKAGAKPSRPRADEPADRAPDSTRSDRERLKVVSLPEPRVRRRHRSERPSQNAMLAVIVILAALLGALIAAVFLEPGL
jgi:hypothetical protein